jgi:hypothetical protein
LKDRPELKIKEKTLARLFHMRKEELPLRLTKIRGAVTCKLSQLPELHPCERGSSINRCSSLQIGRGAIVATPAPQVDCAFRVRAYGEPLDRPLGLLWPKRWAHDSDVIKSKPQTGAAS